MSIEQAARFRAERPADKIDKAIGDRYVNEGVEIGLEVASAIVMDICALPQTMVVVDLLERAQKSIAELRAERGL